MKGLDFVLEIWNTFTHRATWRNLNNLNNLNSFSIEKNNFFITLRLGMFRLWRYFYFIKSFYIMYETVILILSSTETTRKFLILYGRRKCLKRNVTKGGRSLIVCFENSNGIIKKYRLVGWLNRNIKTYKTQFVIDISSGFFYNLFTWFCS